MEKWFYEIGCFSSLWFNWKNFKNFDLFEKFHIILGHIIILKSFGNSKYYLAIMKLDIFAKCITFWALVQLWKVLGLKYNFRK